MRARARSVTPSLGRPAKLQTYWYTTPEVAIISCGNGNPHGHPNADALARLNTSGVQRIYQTQAGETAGAVSDEIRAKQAVAQDHVVIRSDGASYRVLTERVFASDG